MYVQYRLSYYRIVLVRLGTFISSLSNADVIVN